MKKTLLTTFVAASILIGYQATNNIANSHSAGETSAVSGNPQAGGATCNNCHGESVSALPNGGFVVTQIGSSTPITAYKADTIYNVTLAYTGSSSVRHGFQATCEKSSGGFAGTFLAGTGNKVVSTNYVTHSSSNSVVSPIWGFRWTAPASGSGNVTLYGVIRKNNSAIYTTTLSLTENQTGGGTKGISNINLLKTNLYPNPANDVITISTCSASSTTITVFDLAGNEVINQSSKSINGSHQIEVKNLANGVYFIKVNADNKSSISKFVKQ